MYECQNCEKEFEEPIIIDNEPRCPNCMSGDVIDYKNYTLEEIMDAFEECAKQREELEQENKQLEENNKSYQEEMARSWEKIDNAIEYIKDLYDVRFTDKDKRKLLEILGDKENE